MVRFNSVRLLSLSAPLVIAVAIGLSSCGAQKAAEAPARRLDDRSPPHAVGSASSAITGAEPYCVEGASTDGLAKLDTAALWRLQRHYALCVNDMASGEMILEELIRRGDLDAMYERGLALLLVPGREADGILWLERAADNGHQPSQEALKHEPRHSRK